MKKRILICLSVNRWYVWIKSVKELMLSMKAVFYKCNAFLPLLFLTYVALPSCRTVADNGRREVTKTVIGSPMKVVDLYGYRIIGAYNDFLFLHESRDTARLVVYKVEGDSLKYYKGLINKGRGPYDFYYAEFSLSGDTLFVSNSDPTGMKDIFSIPLDDMSRIDDPQVWKKNSLSEYDIQTGLSFAPYGNGQFIIAGGKSDSRELFSLLDFHRDPERQAIDFFPNDSTSGPLFAKQSVYMECRMRPGKDCFLYANRSARYMFIAAVKDGSLVEKSVIYSHLPQYEISPDGNYRLNSDGEDGIVPYSTTNRVYAQVGRTWKEIRASDTYKGYPQTYMDEIEVYDWNGRFIDNYQTDRPFFTFAVTPDDRYLYTLSMDLDTGERVVMRYEL